MSGRKVGQKVFDWAALAARAPAEIRGEFAAFRARHEACRARYVIELMGINWNNTLPFYSSPLSFPPPLSPSLLPLPPSLLLPSLLPLPPLSFPPPPFPSLQLEFLFRKTSTHRLELLQAEHLKAKHSGQLPEAVSGTRGPVSQGHGDLDHYSKAEGYCKCDLLTSERDLYLTGRG